MRTDNQTTTAIIVGAAKRAISEVSERCTQALKALQQNDHLLALGAMIGLEEQIRSINARLLVLREIHENQNPKTKQKG